MAERRAKETIVFPEPGELVGAFQSFLRLTPGAPEYGAIGGRGYDKVVHGPLFTTFVLAKTCELRNDPQPPEVIADRAKEIHAATMDLRFENGVIIPSVGQAVLRSYAQRRMADPRVEVARRLTQGLSEHKHYGEAVSHDVEILLSHVAMGGGFGETFYLPEPEGEAEVVQLPATDVA